SAAPWPSCADLGWDYAEKWVKTSKPLSFDLCCRGVTALPLVRAASSARFVSSLRGIVFRSACRAESEVGHNIRRASQPQFDAARTRSLLRTLQVRSLAVHAAAHLLKQTPHLGLPG